MVQAASNAEVKQEQKQTKGALDREKQANTALVKSLEREERTSYFRSIALAERELAANNVGSPPRNYSTTARADLRGWEWHYLKRRPYGPFTFRGHNSWVLGVAFSPDGKLVASASSRLAHTLGEIKVWDRTTGKEVYRLLGHIGPVDGVAFSPDGKLLASAGWDRTVKIWDIATGKERHTLAATPSTSIVWRSARTASSLPRRAGTARQLSGTRPRFRNYASSAAIPGDFTGSRSGPAAGWPPPVPTGRCASGTPKTAGNFTPSEATPGRSLACPSAMTAAIWLPADSTGP